METQVVVSKTHVGTFHWYVIGDYNNHILAQGFAKTKKTADRQASQADLLLKNELWAGGNER